MTTTPMRLLAIASRSSDYVEMSALASALAARGHAVTLMYFHSRSDATSEALLRGASEFERVTRVKVRLVVEEEIGQAAVAPTLHARVSSAVESGFYRLVLALRDKLLGIDRARSMRRRYPRLARILKAGYRVAGRIDKFRNIDYGGALRQLMRTIDRLTITRRWWWLLTRPFLLAGMPRLMARAAGTVAMYRGFEQFFLNAIERGGFHAVVIPEDIVGNLWPVSVKAAHACGVPALIFPYTLANKDEAFQSLKSQPDYQFANNRLAGTLYPRWRLKEKGHDLVRLPSAHILAHAELSISPPDPWMMNSGFADAICVDSQAAFDYFLGGGIPAGQMRVVGSISQDRMFERRQNRSMYVDQLREELRLEGRKPILLVSGCPNQLSGEVPFCEYRTMVDVGEHVGQCLAPLTDHYHVVVRPHPNYPEFGDMLRRFGFAVSSAPTFSLVPLCDVFVAFASATIRWAIACGIPTVNYDIFHYGYGEFAAARAVKSVSGSSEFRTLVRSLTPASAAFQALTRDAVHDSAYWSFMDGGSVYRIEEEIHRARERRRNIAKERLQHA